MGRAPCCDKANVKKGPWSPEEDDKLKSYIEEHGTGGNWIALPHKIGLKRCGKSCRLRWLNYLRPNIKHGGFSEEEDRVICSLYVSIGSRWSIIAAQLPGRTDNDIKNYWNTRLKKKLLGRKRDSNPNPNSSNPNGALSSSALERLQLHMHLQALHNPFSFNNKASYDPPRTDRQIIQALTTEAIVTAVSPLIKNSTENAMEVTTALQTTHSNDVMEGNSNNMDVAELHDMVCGKGIQYFPELDCLREHEGMSWWGSSNTGYDDKSSSSSWDSASVVLQHDAVMRGYGIEYNL